MARMPLALTTQLPRPWSIAFSDLAVFSNLKTQLAVFLFTSHSLLPQGKTIFQWSSSPTQVEA